MSEARTRQHILVPCQDLFIADIRRIPVFINDDAVRVHDSIGRDSWAGRRSLERHAGCEFAVDSAWEMNTVLD